MNSKIIHDLEFCDTGSFVTVYANTDIGRDYLKSEYVDFDYRYAQDFLEEALSNGLNIMDAYGKVSEGFLEDDLEDDL